MSKTIEQLQTFRRYLPNLSTSRFQTARGQDAHEYADTFQKNQQPPWLYNLTEAWEKLLEEPYKGVTSDGNIIPDLYKKQDDGVDMARIVSVAEELLAVLTSEQRTMLSYSMNSNAWRSWSNPEFLLRPLGLRLDEVDDDISNAVLRVLEATLSPEGYQKALAAMRINGFLGELCEMPRVMNERSYNFLLFGTPSLDTAWGWSLYGHHLCLNVFLRERQIVISPTFTGAEPNLIDAGPYAGTEILRTEGELGLQLMQSLPDASKRRAQTFEKLHDPGMLQTGDLTVDRWNKDDQRHVCGAFRDNRVVPFEGVHVAEFSLKQKQAVLDIVEQFVLYLPSSARAARLEQVRAHLDETYFSWIGGWGNDVAFYYRVQSPVIIIEFDHHSGVFLTNAEPAKFHTHTVVRTPNAGDYGAALRKPEEALL